jgi:hypothetical protein
LRSDLVSPVVVLRELAGSVVVLELAGSVVVLGEEAGPVGAVSTAVAESMAASSAAVTANLENPINLKLP